jgi:hypothetical protein
MITKEQYEELVPFERYMAQVIVNASASAVPIEYRRVLGRIGSENNIKLSCNCSSGWFKLTSKIYDEYLVAKKKYSVKNEKSSSGRNSKNSKGK